MTSSVSETVCIVLENYSGNAQTHTWANNSNYWARAKRHTAFILTTIQQRKLGFVITNSLRYFSQYSNNSNKKSSKQLRVRMIRVMNEQTKKNVVSLIMSGFFDVSLHFATFLSATLPESFKFPRYLLCYCKNSTKWNSFQSTQTAIHNDIFVCMFRLSLQVPASENRMRRMEHRATNWKKIPSKFHTNIRLTLLYTTFNTTRCAIAHSSRPLPVQWWTMSCQRNAFISSLAMILLHRFMLYHNPIWVMHIVSIVATRKFPNNFKSFGFGLLHR